MAVKLNSYSLAYDIFDRTAITRAYIISTCQVNHVGYTPFVDDVRVFHTFPNNAIINYISVVMLTIKTNFASCTRSHRGATYTNVTFKQPAILSLYCAPSYNQVAHLLISSHDNKHNRLWLIGKNYDICFYYAHGWILFRVFPG